MQLSDVTRLQSISREDFQTDFLRPQKPVVLTDLASQWPALTRWTPAFFQQNHGDKRVPVYDANFVKPGKGYMQGVKHMRLGDYVNSVLSEPQDLRLFLYNITAHIPELLSDISFPDLASGFSKRFVFMFFGAKASVTQMHFDIDMSHVFHTQLHGRKVVTLFPYQQGPQLHRFPFTCRSYVDVHAPDYQQYPGLKDAKGYRFTLAPGDTLFMPAGYWHHMVYEEPGYAISLRCANETLLGKLHGLYNLTLMQGVDRLMNRLAPERWYGWKERQAGVV